MKKKVVKIRKKLNNAGMTLIEILVAMALLVIAIIPLSGGYIYSAKQSAKAKHLQQTSILAHTMIENCKAYSVEEIEDMVTDGSDATKFLDNATTEVLDSSVTDGYQYYFDDVVVYDDGAGNTSSQVYDLSMRIKPDPNQEKKIMLYSNMNKYTDAVFMANQTPDTTGTYVASQCDQLAYEYALGKITDKVNEALSAFGYTLITTTDVAQSLQPSGDNAKELKLKRTIDIIPQVAGGIETVRVKYRYDFEYNYLGDDEYNMTVMNGAVPATVTVPMSSVMSSASVEYDFDIFSNSVTGDKATLGDIYLFYYPAYKDTGNGILFSEDNIQVSNGLSEELNLYLIKQNPGFVDTVLSIYENDYSPNVTVTGTYEVNIFHNLNVNIGGGATVGWSPYTSVNVVWQDFDSNPSDTVIEPMIGDIDKKLMYTVEVSIHPSDSFEVDAVSGAMGMTKEALSSMDGTFLNW